VRGLVWRKTVTFQRVLPVGAVRLDLFSQLGFATRPLEKVAKPAEERVHDAEPLCRGQHPLDRAHHAVELGALSGQLFPSGRGECVVTRAAIVL
jgi:hypothetical protein